MKKSIKIISILIMVMAMIMVAMPTFAVNAEQTLQNISGTTPTGTGANNVLTLVNTILGFLQWAAIIGGVVIITILGVKYMMGSLEEKAEYKKSMIPLIVGVVVVMGATSIAKLLFSTFAMK